MKLIRNAKIYSPTLLGIKDILIEGNKIIAIEEGIEIQSNAITVEEIDVEGQMVLPGYIDQHVHAIGGGGEDGPYSRTPEVVLSDVICAGVTTVVGVLGTDGTTRQPESLLTKMRGLEKEGISTYMLTGSYEIPLVTITESAKRDIILIDKVLGIGEIAISDHRSSQPTLEELKKIVTQSRVGGMLAGKQGVVQFHVGEGKGGIEMLREIIDETEIPPHHLMPTHINRSLKLLGEGIEFAKRGGYIDITSCMSSSELSAATAIRICKESHAPMERVTMSSDGNGSMAEYDEKGRVKKLLISKMDSLHKVIQQTILEEKMNPEEVFMICTENVAKANGIWPAKGSISVGADSDLLFLDEDYNISSVMAKGEFMMKDKKLLVKGTFE